MFFYHYSEEPEIIKMCDCPVCDTYCDYLYRKN